MVPLSFTVSIREEEERQGRSLGWLLNRGGCNRLGPFFSHVDSLKSPSAEGQVPARGLQAREAGSCAHPLRRSWLTYMITSVVSTFVDVCRQGAYPAKTGQANTGRAGNGMAASATNSGETETAVNNVTKGGSA